MSVVYVKNRSVSNDVNKSVSDVPVVNNFVVMYQLCLLMQKRKKNLVLQGLD